MKLILDCAALHEDVFSYPVTAAGQIPHLRDESVDASRR
ncbi:MAG: hypothetical protein JWN42_2372 [Candidatus Angelobacter sp.]|jgi:hypothetical protein|nr:hypothetical protein [Candidatus Angelobacter sp.]